ncbi:3-hydroxyacyl-ACP dehydratase FabZ family protein [Psychroflexus maritimus]|uniref:Hydroxymyristoyl-ACP dehydratase n=1 Tax=Psychroflexus maritimus TaxID=2714865 RepID=A0A967AC42_9FLAO|nr:hydroxymyristoyl-ACP dehydratase [Psychroflexus maritimus]NGZ89532.1 hydroxymyristoyl-ACP dehydratase [Psychroflexus maritimus]
MNLHTAIISKMPYGKGFLFIDEIETLTTNKIKGSYSFPVEAEYYAHHFPSNPVTPGVLLTECAAQIGLVAFGIFLLTAETSESQHTSPKIAFTSAEVDFLKSIPPGEKVHVEAKKIYFRFQKLKVSFKLLNSSNEVAVQGKLSGMFQLEKSNHE